MDEYQEYYRDCLEAGVEYQDFVFQMFYQYLRWPLVNFQSRKFQQKIGENINGVEIKLDRKFKETGNLYIETAEKSHPDVNGFSLSGIYREDNTWLYVIGDYETIFIFGKRVLQFLEGIEGKYEKREISTSKGYLLSFKQAEICATYILYPTKEDIDMYGVS